MTPEHDPPAPEAPPTERDAKGRFLHGNKGGPGNPHAREVALLRVEFSAFLGEGRARPLAEALYQEALKGDAACARLLLHYGLGKPAEQPCAPDEVDVHEMLLNRRSMATTADEPPLKPSVYAAQTVNALVSAVRPGLHTIHMAECARTWQEDDAATARKQSRQQRRKERREARAAEAAPEAPLVGPGLSLSVEETSDLLRHPLLRDLDRQAKQRDGRRDGSRSDTHRGPNADSKRPQSDRAANPPRDDQPPTNGR